MTRLKSFFRTYHYIIVPFCIHVSFMIYVEMFMFLNTFTYIVVTTCSAISIYILYFLVFVKPRWSRDEAERRSNIRQVIKFITIFEKYIDDKKPRQIYISKDASEILKNNYYTWTDENKTGKCEFHIDYDLKGYTFKSLPDSDIIKTIDNFYI